MSLLTEGHAVQKCLATFRVSCILEFKPKLCQVDSCIRTTFLSYLWKISKHFLLHDWLLCNQEYTRFENMQTCFNVLKLDENLLMFPQKSSVGGAIIYINIYDRYSYPFKLLKFEVLLMPSLLWSGVSKLHEFVSWFKAAPMTLCFAKSPLVERFRRPYHVHNHLMKYNYKNNQNSVTIFVKKVFRCFSLSTFQHFWQKNKRYHIWDFLFFGHCQFVIVAKQGIINFPSWDVLTKLELK